MRDELIEMGRPVLLDPGEVVVLVGFGLHGSPPNILNYQNERMKDGHMV